MPKDTLDRALFALLLLSLAALPVVLAGEDSSAGRRGGDKAMERRMAYQARVELLRRVYAPVETLRDQGRLPEALLKLDQLARQYPQEAHGHILKGEILGRMGSLDQAVASYVQGVRLNADYVDDKSPLSRRSEIEKTAEEGVRAIGADLKLYPENRSLAAALKNVNYLRSRLAGGCE